MKVAVLLTGQLRTFELLKYLHMNALIKPYNADVFLGISRNVTDDKDVLKVKDFFKPIDTFILNDSDHFKDDRIVTQYYVVKNTYNMLKLHSDRNNITYDLIIRLRFDQYIFTKEVHVHPQLWDTDLNTVMYNETNINILKNHTFNEIITFDEIQDNSIYVFTFGDFKHYKYANDQFFYHNHSLLDKMFEFYDHITPIMKHCHENNIGQDGALIECVLYLYITHFNNINLKRSNVGGFFIR